VTRLLLAICAAASLVIIAAFLLEYVLEQRAAARLMQGQTFARVADATIRYRLRGTEHPGALIVFLTGLAGTLEQEDALQKQVSSAVPSLAYDRAGYGFSHQSSAHDAEGQAAELAGLLDALRIQKPVVLVGYSSSAPVARVFAARYPDKTAALYLIEPWMPELEVAMPKYSARHYYARRAVQNFLLATFGVWRITGADLQDPTMDPASLSGRVSAEANLRRSHHWAVLAECFDRPLASQEALAAHISPAVPMEIVSTAHRFSDDEPASLAVHRMYAQLVSHSDHGRLVDFGDVDHTRAMYPGPMFDGLVKRMKELSLEYAR
jgi:pimeloyl-ACP methyl ester carboxylesterase